MDLSIITVTYNAQNFIAEQTRSVVLACEGIEYEQIIIDNGSSDYTVKVVENVKNLKLIKNGKNLGFGAANNQGIKIAVGEFILFLNPDTRLVGEGVLKISIEWMREHKEIGIMGCKLVNEDGKLNIFQGPRRFPKVWEQIAIIFKIPHLFPRILKKYHYQDLDLNRMREVDTVRGSFMLVRREIVDRLGGQAFDPRYFIWFEEVDLCREVKKMGYKVIYNPEIICVDLVGQTFKKLDLVWRQKQFTKSMLIYFQKWEPWWKWMWIALFRPIGIGISFIYNLICVILSGTKWSKESLK